jgi:hypothetical protein
VVHLGEAESLRKVVGLGGVAKVGQQVDHDLDQWRTVIACLNAWQTLVGGTGHEPLAHKHKNLATDHKTRSADRRQDAGPKPTIVGGRQ